MAQYMVATQQVHNPIPSHIDFISIGQTKLRKVAKADLSMQVTGK